MKLKLYFHLLSLELDRKRPPESLPLVNRRDSNAGGIGWMERLHGGGSCGTLPGVSGRAPLQDIRCLSGRAVIIPSCSERRIRHDTAPIAIFVTINVESNCRFSDNTASPLGGSGITAVTA